MRHVLKALVLLTFTAGGLVGTAHGFSAAAPYPPALRALVVAVVATAVATALVLLATRRLGPAVRLLAVHVANTVYITAVMGGMFYVGGGGERILDVLDPRSLQFLGPGILLVTTVEALERRLGLREALLAEAWQGFGEYDHSLRSFGLRLGAAFGIIAVQFGVPLLMMLMIWWCCRTCLPF